MFHIHLQVYFFIHHLLIHKVIVEDCGFIYYNVLI